MSLSLFNHSSAVPNTGNIDSNKDDKHIGAKSSDDSSPKSETSVVSSTTIDIVTIQKILSGEVNGLTVGELLKKLNIAGLNTSMLNSVLYKNRGLFVKTMIPPSKAPHWKNKYTEAEMKAKSDNKSRVVEYLTKNGASATSKIAEELNVTKPDLNSLLYAMEKLDLVSKTAEANGTKPTWSLKQGPASSNV